MKRISFINKFMQPRLNKKNNQHNRLGASAYGLDQFGSQTGRLLCKRQSGHRLF